MLRAAVVPSVLLGCSYWPAYADCEYDDARRQRTNQRNDIGYDRVPARNGSASVAGDAVLYQSQPGFTGQDSFTFTLSGSGPGGTGSSAVQVSVTVH